MSKPNTRQIKDEHVSQLLLKDGLGPDEALDEHVDEYAREITGREPTPTSRLRVEQALRRIYRRATGRRL